MPEKPGAAGPPQKRNKQYLHWGAQPEPGHRFAAQLHSFHGSIYICDKHATEKRNQAYSCKRARCWQKQACCSKKFQNARDVNDEQWLREDRWNHSRQVVLHFVEMCGSGENEHHRECVCRRIVPMDESRDAKRADSTQYQPRAKEHNQYGHKSAILGTASRSKTPGHNLFPLLQKSGKPGAPSEFYRSEKWARHRNRRTWFQLSANC